MHIVKVKLKARSYDIVIGSNITSLLGKYIAKLDIGSDAYIITNAYLKNKYGKALDKALGKYGISARFKTVPDTEKSKSIETASLIISDLTRYDKKRHIFIIAFGGGVIGDLAGFVASVYKRGIPYVQVPTTLLAQVDSSIGGKTAVDLTAGKNLVGAFYQPRLVFSDAKILKTLSPKQLKSGLAEIIKYGIIKDPGLFGYLQKRYKDVLGLNDTVLELIIKRCSSIKAKIVEQDEREERGIRTVLNFGHTIGHAIEAACNYRGYNHGEAISLGMLVSCDISKKLGLLKDKVSQRIENLIKAVGLPARIRRISIQNIIKAYYHDKKFISSKNRFVLITGIGKTKIVENIPLEIIKEALCRRI